MGSAPFCLTTVIFVFPLLLQYLILALEPPALPSEDEISQALNAIGVRYSHQNDLILQPSNVEQVRASDALKVGRHSRSFLGKSVMIGLSQRRKAEARAKRARPPKGAAPAVVVVEAWPPRRSRLSPDERFVITQVKSLPAKLISGRLDWPIDNTP